jgi:putative transposase
MHTSPSPPGYRALRKGRISIPNHPYLITTVCLRREPRFASQAAAEAAATALQQPLLWRDSRLLCWVLMPDHLHALITIDVCETLPALIRRMKCNTALAANRAGGRSGAVWMPGYHDRALRREDDLLSTARYVVANPLRAGLVGAIADYPYWGAIWCDRETPAL